MLLIYIVVGSMLITASIEGTEAIRVLSGRCCKKKEKRQRVAPAATVETQEGEIELKEEEKIVRRKMITTETIAEEEEKESERR